MLLAPFWTLGARGHALVWVSFGCARRSTPRPRSAAGASCASSRRRSRRRARGGDGRSRSRRSRGRRAVGDGGRVRERAARRDDAALLDRAPSDRAAAQAARRVPRGDVAVAARGDADRRRRSSASRVVQRLRQRDVARGRVVGSCRSSPVRCGYREQADRRQLFPEHRRREEPLLSAGLRLDVLVGHGRDHDGPHAAGPVLGHDEPARVAAGSSRVLWLVGAVRVGCGGRGASSGCSSGARDRRAPFALMLAVVASSGLWSFQNYRYIAPAFPLLS